MTWQWSAKCMSNEPDVARGALHSSPQSAKGLEITLLALGTFWCLLEVGPPGGVASPQQNDPLIQGPVRAGQWRVV